jgi:hypothetical protein
VFVSQSDIIKTHEESFIKKVEYDKKHVKLISYGSIFGGREFIGRLIITINSQNRSITATTSNFPPEDTYKTYYKRYNWYVNEIITKGNDTKSIAIAISNDYVTIKISNEFEILKTFLLKKTYSIRQSDITDDFDDHVVYKRIILTKVLLTIRLSKQIFNTTCIYSFNLNITTI